MMQLLNASHAATVLTKSRTPHGSVHGRLSTSVALLCSVAPSVRPYGVCCSRTPRRSTYISAAYAPRLIIIIYCSHAARACEGRWRITSRLDIGRGPTPSRARAYSSSRLFAFDCFWCALCTSWWIAPRKALPSLRSSATSSAVCPAPSTTCVDAPRLRSSAAASRRP